jgi:hypothetical protein
VPAAAPPAPVLPDPDAAHRLRSPAARWPAGGGAERADPQRHLVELCDALGVERPRPVMAAPY